MVQIKSGAQSNLSHEERTATEPRGQDLHQVVLASIQPVNSRIKLFRLAIKDKQRGINFLPGQWLDVHVPGIDKAGGFTITSTPRDALPDSIGPSPFLELAVQKSPENLPAAWLWRNPEEIMGNELSVRVGGSFVWPPPAVDLDRIRRVTFIAGGVGINPLISILSHLHQSDLKFDHVRFLYMTKMPPGNPRVSEILFLPRLLNIFQSSIVNKPSLDYRNRERLELYFTGCSDNSHFLRYNNALFFPPEDGDANLGAQLPPVTCFHRIDQGALGSAIGNQNERASSVYYICGPPEMTDDMVEYIRGQDHVAREQVFCEKWW